MGGSHRGRRAATALALGAMSLSAACYRGASSAPEAEAGTDSAGGSAAGDDDGDGDGGDSTGAAAGCDAPAVGETPLHRLTRDQYANAVRDLLGVEPNVGGLDGDEKLGPFATNFSAPVSSTTVNQYRALAETIATDAVGDLATLSPCDPAAAGCLETFVETFGRRVYRRPLDEAETARYVALGQVGEDTTASYRLVLQAMLQSPHFLYQLELPPADPEGDVVALGGYELASRLSFFLWSSTPDDTLLDAAGAGDLSTPEGLRAQAERLLADPRAEDAIASFHLQWIEIDELDLATKDPLVYPAFDETLREAMRAETRRFSTEVVLRGDARLDTLLGASFSYLEGPLFELYGVAEPAGHDPADPIELPAGERAGLLTQAAFLATHAHANQSGPIQRGVVVRSNIMCDPPPPPPPDINVVPPDPDPSATTREIFEEHTADPACAGCHALIDGVGLGFEGYDGIGAYRDTQNGLPVDQSGEVVGTDVAGPFVGAVELAQKLAGSEQVRECVATQWFRFAFGRIEAEDDTCTLDGLRDVFAASGYDVRELLVAIVQTDAFRYRAVTP